MNFLSLHGNLLLNIINNNKLRKINYNKLIKIKLKLNKNLLLNNKRCLFVFKRREL